MRQTHAFLTFETRGQGLTDITAEVAEWLRGTGIAAGTVTLFSQHTSASLLITENASQAVQRDLLRWLARTAPESEAYEHDCEGPDDMPAHLKSVLTGSALVVPVAEGRMLLGAWQGVFLAEHRTSPHRRSVVCQAIGD